MLEVQLPLTDWLRLDDMSGDVLLDGISHTDFHLVGM